MRAQWVCSRERRIALYKRSSINIKRYFFWLFTASACSCTVCCVSHLKLVGRAPQSLCFTSGTLRSVHKVWKCHLINIFNTVLLANFFAELVQICRSSISSSCWKVNCESHVHFIHDSLALWETQLGATTTVQPKTAHQSQIPGCEQHTLYSDTLQINPSYKLLMLCLSTLTELCDSCYKGRMDPL